MWRQEAAGAAAATIALMREVLAGFPTGVTAVVALVHGRPTGLVVSSFTSVSLEPPMVLVCIGHRSVTWRALAGAPRIGISVLSARHEAACRQLSGPRQRRFTGLAWHATAEGAVLLDGARAWFECSVERQWPAGDHDIVLLRVHGLGCDQSQAPLVFYGSGLRRLQKLEEPAYAS